MASPKLTTRGIVAVVAHFLGAGLSFLAIMQVEDNLAQTIGTIGVTLMMIVGLSMFAERLKAMD